MNRSTILMMVFLALATACAGSTHGPHRVTNTQLACTDKQIRERVGKLAAEGDKEAAMQLATTAQLAKKCVVWEAGQIVIVEHVELLGLTKVHLEGDPIAYWMLGEALEEMPVPQRPN